MNVPCFHHVQHLQQDLIELKPQPFLFVELDRIALLEKSFELIHK